MSTWLVVLAASAATYLIRVSMVVAFHRRRLPARLEGALSYAGPAVLASLVTAAVVTPHGSVEAPPAAGVAAIVAAAGVARWRDSPLLALGVGLLVVVGAAAVGWF